MNVSTISEERHDFLGNGLLSVKIQIHQPFGRGDVQGFVFPVNLCDKLLGGGDEDFGAVMVNLHQRIVGEFHEIFAGADLAQAVVNNFKSNHFVEVETVAGKFRQAAEWQIQIRLHKFAHVVYVHVLQFDDKLVVAAILQFLNHIGEHFPFGFDEHGLKVEVAFAVIDIKKGTQLAFQSERFC